MKILLKISYVGTAYCGYQLQGEKPTVALMLNRAAKKVFGFECNVTGCSRTDSGVHALGYCLTVDPVDEKNEITVPLDKIPLAMNTALPRDISVLCATWVPDDFHPRYSVIKKEYIYRIRAGEIRDPFLDGRVMELGRNIDTLSIENMKKAQEHFIGRHDFSAFMASGSSVKDTVRTVYDSEITVKDNIIEYRISADGFLYNMVRIIVGTLLDVGKGKIKPEDLPDIISSKDRSRAGQTAKAEGLYLNRVFYN
ncbi:MAG: tRNA pseudouridine(38-40) synthase TruA [Clostridia bacterium]|nr:tRNA pseudouridine(38-40) synthase TruA [Clostridia bacterium]